MHLSPTRSCSCYLRIATLVLIGSLVSQAIDTHAAGTTVVDFAYDVQIRGIPADGKAWAGELDDFKMKGREPASASQFPAVEYRGKVFVWQFAVGARGFGGRIQSLATGPVCFRFDQATLKSDSNSSETPMRVSSVVHRPSKGPAILNLPRPNEIRQIAAPSLCFSNSRPEHFDLTPDLMRIFPNNRMFNVRVSDGEGRLIEDGVGHWVELGVPIEFDGQREVLSVRFTATASKTRTSLH